MPRNPDWTRDELILALDLYLRSDRRQLDASSPAVLELSTLLNRLPIHDGALHGSDFRNPNGVAMKLGNFTSVDPQYAGRGLTRGNRLERIVWDDFASDPDRLRRVAGAIRASVDDTGDAASDPPIAEDEEFPEGRILTSVHRRKERNGRVVARKKQHVLRVCGRLECECCSFDFVEAYGPLGEGFAECHHTVPVSELSPDHSTRLADLAIVCSNCHRMLHRSRPMLSVSQLRALVAR